VSTMPPPLPSDPHLIWRHLGFRLVGISLSIGLFAGLYIHWPGPVTGGFAAGVASLGAGMFAIELERHAL
jgi:hypothetical protein